MKIVGTTLTSVNSFIKESNAIENIYREPNASEVEELVRFMELDFVTIEDLERFVRVYQPNARLRDKLTDNVKVGSFYPPLGGPEIRLELHYLLDKITRFSAFEFHQAYESLHPFTDGNGRSGRALWAWKVRDLTDGFLRPWYFQSLANNVKVSKWK